MRVIFAGTPEFAAKALEALIQSEHEVVMVLSQPDRPAGRGRNVKEGRSCGGCLRPYRSSVCS